MKEIEEVGCERQDVHKFLGDHTGLSCRYFNLAHKFRGARNKSKFKTYILKKSKIMGTEKERDFCQLCCWP